MTRRADYRAANEGGPVHVVFLEDEAEGRGSCQYGYRGDPDWWRSVEMPRYEDLCGSCQEIVGVDGWPEHVPCLWLMRVVRRRSGRTQRHLSSDGESTLCRVEESSVLVDLERASERTPLPEIETGSRREVCENCADLAERGVIR